MVCDCKLRWGGRGVDWSIERLVGDILGSSQKVRFEADSSLGVGVRQKEGTQQGCCGGSAAEQADSCSPVQVHFLPMRYLPRS